MSTNSIWPTDSAEWDASIVHLCATRNKREGAERADEVRVYGRFVREERGVYCVIGWSCESVISGYTKSELDGEGWGSRFWTLNSLAYRISDLARLHAVGAISPSEVARRIRVEVEAEASISRNAPAWVGEWLRDSVDGEQVAAPAPVVEAQGSGESIGDQVKRLANPKRKPAAKAEPSPSPVETPAVVVTLAEVGAAEHSGIIVHHEAGDGVRAPADTVVAPVFTPTHFRGIILRPAADWADPSAEGVFVGVSNADYHADKLAVGGSGLGDYLKSAAHAKIEKSIPARSRDIGTLVHGDVLENKDAAGLGFAVVEGKTTTKANTVTDDMVRIAKACAAALREDEHTAKVATTPGLRELSCRVRCLESGLMLKCRFDLAPDAGGWAWDIKTTSSEDPGEFAVSFGNFGYSLQAAHYLRVAALLGLPFRAMAFACVSTEAPFEVWLVKFGPVAGCEELHALATRAAVEACKIEAKSRAEGRWEKRKHAPVVAELKPWHLTALRQLANGEGVPH